LLFPIAEASLFASAFLPSTFLPNTACESLLSVRSIAAERAPRRRGERLGRDWGAVIVISRRWPPAPLPLSLIARRVGGEFPARACAALLPPSPASSILFIESSRPSSVRIRAREGARQGLLGADPRALGDEQAAAADFARARWAGPIAGAHPEKRKGRGGFPAPVAFFLRLHASQRPRRKEPSGSC
jgi:hypothetical protein